MGAVWSEQRKLDTWLAGGAGGGRRAGRAGRGARGGRRRDPRARRLHRRGGEGAREGDRPRRGRLRGRGGRVGGRGGALGAPRAHLLGRARHALALQIAAGRADPRGGRARLPRRAGPPRARARGHALRRAARTACTPSPPRSGSSWPASPSRPTATCTGSSARSRASSVGALSGAVGTYAANGPELEAAVLEPARARRARTSRPRWWRATATPSCSSAIALAGAGLERFATEIRHLQRTEVREVEEPFRAGPEGLVGDAAQAQPDRERAHHRHRPAAARLRAGRARERGAVARARHLALLGRAGGAARRHDPARLRAAPRHPRGGRA